MTDCSSYCIRTVECLSRMTGNPIAVTYCRNCLFVKSVASMPFAVEDGTNGLETVYRSVYRISALLDGKCVLDHLIASENDKIVQHAKFARNICPRAEFLCFEVTCPRCLASAVKVPGSYLGFVTIEDPNVS